MLLAFIALIALVDGPLTWLGEITGLASLLGQPTNLATLLGYLLAPLAWIIGVPWQDATVVGGLIGQKVVINEFVAYLQLAEIIKGNVAGVVLTDKGRLIDRKSVVTGKRVSVRVDLGGRRISKQNKNKNK